MSRQIGTVEVLRFRLYGDVAIMPGVYPIFRDNDGTIRWVMTGTINEPRVEFDPVPDMESTFFVQAWDEPTDTPAEHVGTWTQAEFDDLLTDPVCTEGHVEQRLRVVLS